MEIRKILNLSQDEVQTLATAGQLLRAIGAAVESGEVTEFSEETKKLLARLAEVATEVAGK